MKQIQFSRGIAARSLFEQDLGFGVWGLSVKGGWQARELIADDSSLGDLREMLAAAMRADTYKSNSAGATKQHVLKVGI